MFYINFFPLIGKDSKFADKYHWIYDFLCGYSPISFATVFSYGYFLMITIIVLVSIAMPIDRAMDYVRVVSVIFAFITLTSLAGIIVFLG